MNDGIRIQRTNVLRRPVGDFREWSFELRCPGCRTCRAVPTTEVIRHYGGRHLVSEIVERFTCSQCRSTPAAVCFVAANDRITLRGQGSLLA